MQQWRTTDGTALETGKLLWFTSDFQTKTKRQRLPLYWRGWSIKIFVAYTEFGKENTIHW
jgi:hypothetical protein